MNKSAQEKAGNISKEKNDMGESKHLKKLIIFVLLLSAVLLISIFFFR
jgi:hypothetical protein